jgi:hypothetical protein
MTQRIFRSVLVLVVSFLASTAVTLAQSALGDSAVTPDDAWRVAQASSSPKTKLTVVTVDQLQREQTCRVRSFTSDKIVCSRALGRPRTYLRAQVAALILPGDGGARLPLWLGLNGGLGAAIWGTVVLTATCPLCAAGTAIVALLLFGAAGAVVYADDMPARLLYLAPGQELRDKLGYAQR